jgi:hypothetical protein
MVAIDQGARIGVIDWIMEQTKERWMVQVVDERVYEGAMDKVEAVDQGAEDGTSNGLGSNR